MRNGFLIITLTGLLLSGCAANIGTRANGGLAAEVYPVKLVPQGSTGVLRIDTPNKGCASQQHNGCIRFAENTIGLMKFYLPGAKKTAQSCDSGAQSVITQIDISVVGSGEKGDFDPSNLPLPPWVETQAFPLVDRATGHAYQKDVSEGLNQVWLLNTNANNPQDGTKIFWYRVKAESCDGPPRVRITDPRGENDGTIR